MAVSQTLSVTEVANSTNVSANTSKVRILWQSTQSGDSWNGYTRTAKYYISINGEAEREYTVSYTLPQSSTKTILDTTITVTHKGDGTGTVKVRTWMDTSISAGVVEQTQTLNLATIPRASTITSASNATLGKACAIKWTPLSTSFRYKLKFTLGSFSYTTGAIHPNAVVAYTYDKYMLPLADIAPQITSNPPSDTMTVTLYTYSDSGATAQIGSTSSATFTVTVPENASTKPSVTMTLSPVSSLGTAFSSLYIQGKSKVKAPVSGSGQYGATIDSTTMFVQGKSNGTYESDYLTKFGAVTVKGRAIDSRGFDNEIEKTITVIPYSKPSLIPASDESGIICARCDKDGKLSESGAYLKIKARRKYSKVSVDGQQKNFCTVRYQYKKTSDSSFSPWVTLLSNTVSSDEIDSDPIGNIVSSTTTSYVIRLSVVDTIGEESAISMIVPSDEVTFNMRDGGMGAAFGKYSERERCLDIADNWDVVGRVYSLGAGKEDIPNNSDLNDYKSFGVYNITSNTTAETLSNCPYPTAGVLIVSSSNGDAKQGGAWAYILQRYISFDGRYEFYRLMHTSDTADEWIYAKWEARSNKPWTTLGLSSEVSASTTNAGRHLNGNCYYRVVDESHVYVAFNCACTYSGNSITVNASQIPSPYKPARHVYALCTMNNRCIARVFVNPSGDVRIDYVQDMASSEATTSHEVTWIDGYIDYWI